MTTQEIVNEIYKSYKTEDAVEYTFRNPDDKGMDVKIFSWDEVDFGLVRLWRQKGFDVIARRIVNIPVGTLNPPPEHEKTGGYGE